MSETRNTRSHDREAERHLILRARDGEPAALRALIDGHKDRLYAFIWRMIRHHHDAEEICQETFLKAFASLDSFSDQYRFSTWLFTIGYRVCLNSLRRKKALTGEVEFSTLPLESDETPTSTLESEDANRLKRSVWSAVERLSTPQRASVVLFYRHECSCQEIAEVLELPVATVKSHLHRGRARLRQLLEHAGISGDQLIRNFAG